MLSTSLGKSTGYEYGRTHNLNTTSIGEKHRNSRKRKIRDCFCFRTCSNSRIDESCESGDHIIVSSNVYGGTYRLYELNLTNYGLEYSWVDTSNPSNIENAIRKNTKMIFVETPTNPMLILTDLESSC